MKNENVMRSYIHCKLPDGEDAWQAEPFLGSDVAVVLGCTCPFVQPWPGAYVFEQNCPIHELVTIAE